MKRIVNLLAIAAVTVLLHSCQEQEYFEVPMNEEIVLDLSASATRAASTSNEEYVDHIDVFIFEEGTDGNPTGNARHERHQVNNSRQLTLNAKRSSFDKDTDYRVYLIANSNKSVADFTNIAYGTLLTTKQEDLKVHLTGLAVDGAPKYFLMDAVAKDGNGNSSVKLNNGNLADNTVLNAELRRAAAKVQVTVTAADNIEFKDLSADEGYAGYYVRNLSYDAFLLAEAKADEDIEAKVLTTSETNSEYFAWQPETDSKKVTLTVYAYPNHWSNNSIMEHETSIVVNLPMSYNDGSEVKDYPNNWYKIPMTNDQTLRRNHYYAVNITLDRPGASEVTEPVTVDPIYYAVEDWVQQDINVGGEDKPRFLMVNRTELEMYNIDMDATSLEFASSTPVTIAVKDMYYYNKYGVKTEVTGVSISGTTDEGSIGGNITVNSPTPTNNTIRYFTLVVTNEQGLTREVMVSQYPLVYITNIQSYYSYRSDFLISSGTSDGTATGNHYEDRRSYSRFAVDYSRNGTHTYSEGGDKSSGFFVSKFVSSTHESGNNQGLSDVDFYSKNGTGNFNDPYNARMYHIRITATSGDYILGRPKITNGVTDPGEDNARMVSPSFMIASRLGTLTTSEIPSNANLLTVYSEHAKQYVEVYEDPKTGKTVHLSDWRLPTEAELKIIYQFQGTKSDPANADAIDYLLNARNYYSASGPVENPKYDMSGTSVRCIRDVYEVAE